MDTRLDIDDSMAKICRHTLFKPELNQPATDKLLTHVIRGEQAKAEKMIKNNPHLLLETGIVVDYSGRKIEGTALQLALGADDVKYHDNEECMVEMIYKYLKKLPNGEAIIAEQTAKQFPDGWQVKEEQRAMRDSDVLRAVINAIANSTDPADWEKAIHTLRSYLEFENKSNLFQTGKHFNHQLLVEALDLFNQNYDQFGKFNSAKNNTVWRQVIGTIERYVPATTAQALCTGVGKIVAEKGKLDRTLALHNYHSDRSVSYFPLDVESGSILGRDFAVYSYYASTGVTSAQRQPNWLNVGSVEAFCSRCKTYVEQKHQTCNTYAAATASTRSLEQACNLLK